MQKLGKRPRHYAAEICKLPTREQRAAALQQVPEEWQELVKKHVSNLFKTRSNS